MAARLQMVVSSPGHSVERLNTATGQYGNITEDSSQPVIAARESIVPTVPDMCS